ncbi:histidine phosphatase family protein [Amycolatopsis taiwanensis]|uniref:histidine phosphatase family protein n=1 Tax=Amycolatopsis taiwanensis TaxID=342230 RepID=UPI000486486E|nr:histidine phosphatase family protein [Amycolatopsis taiwanensis]
MGVVYLITHGQASFPDNVDARLSAGGVEQAAVVGAELLRRTLPLSSARSGTQARQVKTAEIVLDWLGHAALVEYDPRWNEYDHTEILRLHGDDAPQRDLDPRACPEILDAALTEWVAAGAAGPCAETWPAFVARVEGALRDVVSLLEMEESAIVFTSGGVISTLAGLVLGTPEAGLLKLNPVIVNCGITRLESTRNGVTLLSFNEHAHLEGRASRLLSHRAHRQLPRTTA